MPTPCPQPCPVIKNVGFGPAGARRRASADGAAAAHVARGGRRGAAIIGFPSPKLGRSRYLAMTVNTDILPPRYRGPQQIGRGGMGEIYRATDSTLGRAVAIKVLAEPYAQDESIRERFMREALSAARLSGQPNTVTIYDVGEHEGRPYI